MSISLLLTSLLLANPLVLLSSYVSMGSSFPKPLSEEEEDMYLTAYEENGDIEAKNKLIEHNLRLVAHIVKKYSNTGKDPDDLISIGTIGLIKSVNTYKRGKGVRLATYAARCIENAILSQIRLWFQTSTPKAEKSQNGVSWHRFPRIHTSHKKAGVQTLQSLLTCFFYWMRIL